MSAPLPDDVKEILDTPVFVHVGTVNPDGSPQVSVIWIQRDGDLLRFSTAEGRVKARNLRHDPRIHLSFSPLDDPYRNITIQGEVTELATDGTWLIDDLARKYTGKYPYPSGKPGEVRLNVVARPTRVTG